MSHKSTIRIIAAFLLFFWCSANAQNNIHYWDFNGATQNAPNKWPSPQNATTTVNGGTLTHNFTVTDNFGGSTLDADGFVTAVAGSAFCVVDMANNGKAFTLNASTVNYKNIKLSYATRGTASGFTTQTIDYSLDGQNFVNITTFNGTNNTNYSLKTVDFSNINGVNNNPNFKIRITLNGATNATGNNRFDNIRVSGEAPLMSIAPAANAVEQPNKNGSFTITFNPATTANTSFNYNLAGSATFSTDYTASLSNGNPPNLVVANGTITVPPGVSSITVNISPTDDGLAEGTENINLTLSNPDNGYILGTFAGSISLVDDDLIPNAYNWDFQNCLNPLSDGFTQYSVSGPQVWACTTFGHDPNDPNGLLNAPNAVQVNGFANGTNVLNEDWLISPPLNLSGFNFPLLSYFSRTKFNGGPLELKISTDYVGFSNPNNATWTSLNGKFPNQTSDKWTLSDNINLSNFKQNNVYLAWVYKSTNDDGARWTLDDIKIDNSQVPPPPSLSVSTDNIGFGFVANGNQLTKTFKVLGNDLTENITLSATGPFTLSTDNMNFGPNISLDKNIVNNIWQTIQVKFTPSAPDKNYTGTIAISTSNIQAAVNLSGTSIDPAKTLEIVNWNMEWFGSTTLGPTNDVQQETNAKTITQNLGADLFALVEVVDEARLQNVVNNLNTIYGPNTYNYVICNYGSHANPFEANPGPLSEAQKEAFVYKTSVFSNISNEALLSLGVNTVQDLNNPNYNFWSSGRYPYMMKADVNLNGTIKTVRFVLIHAKANTSPTQTSYDRRKNGADALYNYFNTNFPNDNIVLLGDFNDDLDQTITDGINPPTTSYSTFTSDGANYFSPTLSLSLLGKKSTVSYDDVIDHVMLSNEMKPYYMTGSATILTDAADMVSNYGNSTSDHYPVFTRYAFDPLVLPVTLTNFSVVKDKETAKLQWSTSQELNSKQFIIERSTDGLHWTSIATVNAAGNSNILLNYSYVDNSPAKGVNYYRLKQVDIDYSFKYSETKSVVFNISYQVTVSPNPAKEFVNVKVAGAENGQKVTVQITDVNGKVVYNTVSNQANMLINTSHLTKGLYVVKVIGDVNNITTQKLLIQ